MGDSDETRARIIQATGRVLARMGFGTVGVNAIAKEAGVGKPLIYRYFGGLPGLLAAYGASTDFWPSPAELLTGLARDASYARMLGTFLGNYLRALLKRPHTREILAWELLESNPLTAGLDKVLSARARETVASVTNRPAPPTGVDAAAINAVLIAAVHYLTIRSRVMKRFSGLSIRTADDWKRIEAAVAYLAQRAYS